MFDGVLPTTALGSVQSLQFTYCGGEIGKIAGVGRFSTRFSTRNVEICIPPVSMSEDG